MRLSMIAAVLALMAGPALAQPAAPRSAAPAAAARATLAAPHPRRTPQQRFDAANTTHDGHLTLEQARAGRMNAVVRDFADIDTARRGYVTMDEIKAHRRAVRLAKKAAKPA